MYPTQILQSKPSELKFNSMTGQRLQTCLGLNVDLVANYLG